MIQKIGALPPDSNVGGKALGLDLLTRNGFSVPSAWVLDAPEDVVQLKPNGSARYAVRSSASVEDGCETSFAGQFLSRTCVRASEIASAVQDLIQHAASVTKTTEGFSIIVQEWIDARVSGVAFSQHPTKDMRDVIVIDAVTGSNEDLMSGQRNAERAFCWKDADLIPERFLLPASVVTELKQAVVQIAALLSTPADIEWAWDGHTLWILQARPITALPHADATEQEEADVMHFFALHPATVLRRNDFAESAPRPDDATFRMIQGWYQPNGPFHRAATELKLVYHPENADRYLRRIFGWLYADPSCQPVQMRRGLFAGMASVIHLSEQLDRFARSFYGMTADTDPEKTYAKASILAQFAQTQSMRPVAPDLWQLRATSPIKRPDWKEPKTITDLYAIIREDAKVATYTASTGPVIEMPLVITRREAFDLRAPISIDKDGISGQGVSTGIVEGVATIQTTPTRLQTPGILIVPALTPEWIPFLDQNVLGIISETGSSMSHGAIQCRERGVAAIFGAANACKKIVGGSKIEMDGKRGTIRIQ